MDFAATLRRVLNRRASPRLAVCLILLCFWAISLANLTVVPPVYEDEPWQASTAYKLATQGVFGSDVFAGFYGTEQHYYGFAPLHPMLLAAVFRIAGLGVFQDRFEPVAMGMLTLALTFALARRLFGAAVGVLALLFLLLVRWTGTTYIQLTGIPFLDLFRISRYDVVVPVFGLASLLAYISARRGKNGLYLVAGICSGLAGLAHLYGVFWLPALLALTLIDHRQEITIRHAKRPSAIGYLLLGFFLACLPYVVYVATGWRDFIGQTQVYGYESRFDVLNPRWYWVNLATEYRRYGPGLGPRNWTWLLRVGFWSASVGLPLSVLAMVARAWRHQDRAARLVVIPLVVIAVLFALLLRLKLVNYTLTLLPLAAIAGAWGSLELWNYFRTRRIVVGQLVLAALLIAISIEGLARIGTLERAAASTTPYSDFIQRVREPIPANARILALHNYWFGLDDHDFRAFWAPMHQTNPAYVADPVSFDVALDRVAPDIVLLDSRMRGYFESVAAPDAEAHHFATEFWDWMARRGATRIAQVDDATYGRMDIYRVTYSR